MKMERGSRLVLSTGSWLLLGGVVGLLLALPNLVSWKGWLAGGLSLLVLLADPAVMLLAAPTCVRENSSYYRQRLFIAWGLFLGAIVLYLVRDALSLPLDKAVAAEDTGITRLRMLLLAFFLMMLFAGFLFRLWLGLEASSEDAIRDLSVRRRFGTLTALQLIGFVVILAVFNVAAAYRNSSADLTPGLYSYSEPARAILKGIPREVHIIAFLPVQQMVQDTGRRTTPNELFRISEELRVLLEQLSVVNSKFQVRFLNADLLDPGQTDFKGVNNGTILVRTYSEEAAAATPFTERRVSVSGEKDLDRFEKNLLEAIVQVTLPPAKLVFARSNGERAIGGVARTSGGLEEWTTRLRFFNFVPTSAESGTGLAIPDDTKVVVLAAPAIAYSPEARRAVLEFLKKGGGVLALADPTGGEDFAWLLEEMGSTYRLEKGFLSQFADRPGLLFTDALAENEATASMRLGARPAVLFAGNAYFEKSAKAKPAARPPAPTGEKKPPAAADQKPGAPEVAPGDVGWKESEIVFTDGRTFRDRNRNGKRENGEEGGRFALGMSFSGPGRLAIFSDVSWLSNGGLLMPVDHANARLGTDIVMWLAHEGDVPGVLIKERKDRSIQVSDALKIRNIALGVVGFPLLTGVALALAGYLYRRRRSLEANGGES